MRVDNTLPLENDPMTRESAGAYFHWKFSRAQNIGARKQQQDDFLVLSGTFLGKPALLAMVADGMGGMYNGALFSEAVRKSHRAHFQEALNTFHAPEKVLMHLAFQAEKDTRPLYDEDKPGGTTLISALFTEDWFYVLSVGDSRITLFRRPSPRENKAALQINREHTMGVLLDERAWMGHISFEDARENMYRDSLTSSIGAQKIRRMDVTTTPTRFLRGDQLVLMSDGIYRSCHEGEMAALLEHPVEEAAPKIVEYICDKKISRQDNMTIVIIEHM